MPGKPDIKPPINSPNSGGVTVIIVGGKKISSHNSDVKIVRRK